MQDNILAVATDERETGWPSGPWSLKACQSFDGRATFNYYEVWTEDCDVICEEVYRAHNDGGRANMQLIAAAPDLYEALEAAVDAMEAVGMSCHDERAALARARGQS